MSADVYHIKKSELEQCPIIGQGDEGIVYNYNNKCAIKVLTRYQRIENLEKLKRKIKKLSAMMSTQDRNCTLPYGFISINGRIIDGYYTKLVNYRKGRKDFDSLKREPDKEVVLDYLIEGDSILQRLHKKGFILGDIKCDNIMIDRSGNPIFIDTDNYRYKEFGYDFTPDRAGCLYNCYLGPISAQKDNDILLYSIMALRLFSNNEAFDCFQPGENINYYGLRKLRVAPEIKEELEPIFSDSTDKPYIGPILQKIKKSYY